MISSATRGGIAGLSAHPAHGSRALTAPPPPAALRNRLGDSLARFRPWGVLRCRQLPKPLPTAFPDSASAISDVRRRAMLSLAAAAAPVALRMDRSRDALAGRRVGAPGPRPTVAVSTRDCRRHLRSGRLSASRWSSRSASASRLSCPARSRATSPMSRRRSLRCSRPRRTPATMWCRDLEPIFAATPALRGLLSAEADETGRNTLLSRRFPGGSLKIVAAKSPRNLRRHNVRVLLIDEADAMEPRRGRLADHARRAPHAQLRQPQDHPRKHADLRRDEQRAPLLCAVRHARLRSAVPRVRRASTRSTWADIQWDEGQPETAALRCPRLRFA